MKNSDSINIFEVFEMIAKVLEHKSVAKSRRKFEGGTFDEIILDALSERESEGYRRAVYEMTTNSFFSPTYNSDGEFVDPQKHLRERENKEYLKPKPIDKETFIQMLDFGDGKNSKVEISYSQLVGVNSRGNFKVTMDRQKFFRLNKADKLIEYLEDDTR